MACQSRSPAERCVCVCSDVIRAENMYGLSEPLTGREVSVCSDVIRAENMYGLSEPLTGREVCVCV